MTLFGVVTMVRTIHDGFAIVKPAAIDSDLVIGHYRCLPLSRPTGGYASILLASATPVNNEIPETIIPTTITHRITG